MGNGYFDSGKFHLTLAFQDFTPDPALEAQWQAVFEAASELLFNATQGQMQLGTLSIKYNAAFNYKHDIFLNQYPGTSSRQTGPFGGGPLGGWLKILSDELDKEFVIVHELGHYLFDLGDEYCRKGSDSSSVPRCIVDPLANGACLMEYKWSVAIPAGVSEFCINPPETGPDPAATYHDATTPVSHNKRYPGLSCWDVIKQHYSDAVTIPESIPAQDEPEGYESTVWVPLLTISRYLFLIIGSADFDETMTEQAIRNYLKFHAAFLATTEDQAGIVTNQNSLQPTFPMTPVTNNNLNDLFAIIDSLQLNVEGQVEPSMLTALRELTSGEQTSDIQALIQIAPGQSTDDLQSPSGDDLNVERVLLHSTTVGTGAIADFLQQLKEHKRAESFLIDDLPDSEQTALSLQSHNIEQVFSVADGYSIAGFRAGRLLSEGPADPAPNGRFDANRLHNFEYRRDSFDYPVYVDKESSDLWFVLSRIDGQNSDFAIIDPDGVQIDPDHSIDEGAVVWHNIPEPASGRWMMRLQRTAGSKEIPFRMMAFLHNSRLNVGFSANIVANGVQLFSQTTYPDALAGIEQTAEIYLSPAGSAEDAEKVEHVVMQPGRYTTEPDNPILFAPSSIIGDVALASGFFQANVKLDPGIYTAVLRTANAGTAVIASNPEGVIFGNLSATPQPQFPNFVRFRRIQFVVPNKR